MTMTPLRKLDYLGSPGAPSPALKARLERPADPRPGEGEHWAGRIASREQLESWAEAFYRDGCLLIENVLPPDQVERLRKDLIDVLGEDDPQPSLDLRAAIVDLLSDGPSTKDELRSELQLAVRRAEDASDGVSGTIPREVFVAVFTATDETLANARAYGIGVIENAPAPGPNMILKRKMMTHSPEHLALFDLEPVVSLVEMLLGEDCHAIYSTGFRTIAGQTIDFWHQDDPPHFLVLDGDAPSNIQLPPLALACNYYLTDVTPEEADGTQVVPGSHLFGAAPPPSLEGTPWESMIRTNAAPAGSLHIHNCQTWHRGGPNPGRARYMTAVHYGRRLIGHKYYPFMNYQLPEHVLEGADDRRRRLLGFLPHGAYE